MQIRFSISTLKKPIKDRFFGEVVHPELTTFFSPKKPIANRCFVLKSGYKAFFVCIAFLFCTVVQAQSNDSSMSMEQAVAKALLQHPELATYEYRVKSMDGRIEQARVGQRKEISLEIENALGSGDYEGLDQAQATVGIGWVLESSLLDAKQNTARERRSLVEIEKGSKKINIAARVSTVFLNGLYLQEQKKIAQQWRQDVAKMYANTLKVVATGNASNADQYRAKAVLSLSELEVEDLEHEIDTAYKQLAAQWGDSQFPTGYLKGDIYSVVDIGSFENIKASISKSQSFAILSAKENIASSEITRYQIDAKNKWKFNTGIRQHRDTDDFSLVAGVSIPIGGSKRNHGKIASLRSDITVLHKEAEALRISLEAELYALHQSYEHALHVIKVLNQETIPSLKKALDETENAYNIGRSSFQDWIIVQEELVESKEMLLGAYLSSHLNRIEIERLTGSSMASKKNN